MSSEFKKMQPSKTKAQIREEIQREVDRYMQSGGEVQRIPNGVSGNSGNANMFGQATAFEPRKERTPVTELIKDLDARKKAKSPHLKLRRGPKKILITDDFGEPIRWVWEDGQ